MAMNQRCVLASALILLAMGLGAFGTTAVLAATEEKDDSNKDPRGDLAASFFTGLGIDSFAAKDLDQYLNPDVSGTIGERYVAGFDFEYRLAGKGTLTAGQLWIYGETVHGLRSSDVDCSANPSAPVCKDFLPITSGQPTLFIVRN